jgi:hypothetical protein
MDRKHVYGRFYFSFQMPNSVHCCVDENNSSAMITMQEHCCDFQDIVSSPSSLETVYRFSCFLKRTIASNATADIVICVGPIARIQISSAFLLGCFILLSETLTVKELWKCFEQLEISSLDTFEFSEGLKLMDFWGAVHRARWQSLQFWLAAA